MPTKEQERLISEFEEAKRAYLAHASASLLPAGAGKGSALVMEMPPLDLPKVRRNPLIETLCVGIGCIGVCTFCKTRYARGRLQRCVVKWYWARVARLDNAEPFD